MHNQKWVIQHPLFKYQEFHTNMYIQYLDQFQKLTSEQIFINVSPSTHFVFLWTKSAELKLIFEDSEWIL